MKIKEVMEQTGLTDRAIRLYIANGLITPASLKNYAGRNNYSFTDEDVAELQQIALLRKADFSLVQIKSIQQGGVQAKETLQQYMEAKHNELAISQKILSALESLSASEQPSLSDICAKIEDGLREKPMPQTDMKPGKWEIFEKWIMRTVSIPIVVFFGVAFWGMLLTYEEDFPFPKLYYNPLHHMGTLGALLPIAFAVIVLILYWKPQLNRKKQSRRRAAAIGLLLLAIFVPMSPFAQAGLILMPPVYSETDDPGDYMVLGNYEKRYADDICKLFPAKIPHYAVAEDSRGFPPNKFLETTKYYYYHDDTVDPSFHIYAEWVLPVEAFAAEKQRIANYYPEGPATQQQRGDWVCLNFAEEQYYPYDLIFAYNDKTSTVRYITSYVMDGGDWFEMYTEKLDW